MAVSSPVDVPPLDAVESNARFDFSAAAGPLPLPVVEQIAAACRDWRGHGSALSLPFSGDACRELMRATRSRLCRTLDIPDSHDVLFLQGGASAQFSLIPLNLVGSAAAAAYLISGHWSHRAAREAARHCEVRTLDWIAAADWSLPWLDERRVAYLHVTSNETANGTQLRDMPRTRVPLAIDMTSDLFTRPIDWEPVGVAYAALQKSIGVAGLTMVAVRRDRLGRARPDVARVFDYTEQSLSGSRVNTPPVFALIVAQAVLEWIDACGGPDAVSAAVAQRASSIYGVLESHESTYRLPAPSAYRSPTSICFELQDPARATQFQLASRRHGIAGLAGHPETGGYRAANYIGTSQAAVSRLCDLLADFAQPG